MSQSLDKFYDYDGFKILYFFALLSLQFITFNIKISYII